MGMATEATWISCVTADEAFCCSCSVLSKLRSLASSDSASADYPSLLTAMCNWRRGNEVLELISDWLEPCRASSAEPRQRVSEH